MIIVKNLSYHIDNKQILSNIELNLEKGGISALIGPNGAGKSTLLNLMARVLPLESGEVHFDEFNITHCDQALLAQKMAFLPQNSRFLSRLTIEELLFFARFPYHKGRPTTNDKAVIERTLEYFHLKNLRTQFIDELSGGQRQRALVAMIFAQDTDYILLDEPLNHLDIQYARQLMTNLQAIVRDFKKTILVVLHDINYAAHYADYVIAMKNGEIILQGYTNEVINSETISLLYDVPVEMIKHNNKNICVYF